MDRSLIDILGLDSLLAQLVLAFGAAMVLGNGFAIVQHLRGARPAGESGEFRRGRAWFLLVTGLFIGSWGAASLLAR
jgi:hypothetical protein